MAQGGLLQQPADGLQRQSRVGLRKEVPRGQKHQLERAGGQVLPGDQPVGRSQRVAFSADHGQRAIETRPGLIGVRFGDSEVGPEHGRQGTHQVLMLEHLDRGAAPGAQGCPELRLGQGVDGRTLGRQLRGLVGGGDQEGGAGQVPPLQFSSQLKGEQGPQTVAEERIGAIEFGRDRIGQGGDQRPIVSQGRIAKACFPARQLDGADLDGGRQRGGPGAEQGAAAAGVRQAEQPQRRRWVRDRTDDPGGGHRCAPEVRG